MVYGAAAQRTEAILFSVLPSREDWKIYEISVGDESKAIIETQDITLNKQTGDVRISTYPPFSAIH